MSDLTLIFGCIVLMIWAIEFSGLGEIFAKLADRRHALRDANTGREAGWQNG